MPLRPFPFQIGIGTDIVHVNRVRNILQKGSGSSSHLDRYLRRFLTQHEQDEFLSQYGGLRLVTEKEIELASKHLAGRWAAKEATIKALSWRKLSFHDIVIKRASYSSGVHAVILDERAAGQPGSNGSQKTVDQDHDDKQFFPTSSVSWPPRNDLLMSDYEVIEQQSVDPKPTLFENDGRTMEDSNPASTGEPGPLHVQSPIDEAYEDLSGQIAQISISHDGEYATAVCLAAQEPISGDVGGEATARDHL